MFRLRGSHGLPRTARHPELSNYLGVGKGKTATPQSFCFKPTESTEGTEIVGNHILFVQCVLLAMSPLRCPLCPLHQIKIPYICNTIQVGVSRYLAALNQH